MTRPLDASVLIATYNRARLLDETLTSLAAMRVAPTLRWELLIIDNNSSDDTRKVVERRQQDFPTSLRYLFEPLQGRSSALNAGMAAAHGRLFVFTDDDVLVRDGWIDAACGPMLEDPEVAYTGGPVRPIWETPPPAWLDLSRGDLWGTIAIQDHGDAVMSYEAARKVPLGANMAARRDVFERVGGFRTDLGRSGGRVVMGQEVPEWLMRVRRAGLRGLYVPAMEIQHFVPAARLTRKYFTKWWFGKGVSRAALERMQPVTELGLDLRETPHVLGVPRFMYGTLVRDAAGLVVETLRRRPAAAFRHAMGIAFFAGYFTARLRGGRRTSDYRTSNVVTTGR